MIRKIVTIVAVIVFISATTLGRNPTFAKAETSRSAKMNMPVVYVDPPNVIASPGETFAISLKVFNLSNNFHTTWEHWDPGEPLGPYDPAGWYNYSLGNLYGLDIQLEWDPSLLEYVGHTITTPVEDYPEGILHRPIIPLKDDVDANAGTYWMAQASLYPAEEFNSPASNATAFIMAFTVKDSGTCKISITNADLAVPTAFPKFRDAEVVVPCWVLDGEFTATPKTSTNIYFNFNPNPANIGETVFLQGILSDELSQPLPNETVKLYARPLAGSWRYILSLATDGFGVFEWEAAIPIEGTFIFAAYYPGSETYEATYNFAMLVVQ